MKIKKYNNIPIIEQDYKVLKSLEKDVGIIPEILLVQFNFGFVVANHRVVQLSLHDKELSSLPESIGNLTSLSTLYLEKNQLSSLPESIGNLRSLTELSLWGNNLSSSP